MADPSPFQNRVLTAMENLRTRTHHPSADDIAYALRPKSGRLAVTSALRSLERREETWVIRLAPRDQWACARWCLGAAAKAYLENAHG